jgi:hypothetical protein
VFQGGGIPREGTGSISFSDQGRNLIIVVLEYFQEHPGFVKANFSTGQYIPDDDASDRLIMLDQLAFYFIHFFLEGIQVSVQVFDTILTSRYSFRMLVPPGRIAFSFR